MEKPGKTPENAPEEIKEEINEDIEEIFAERARQKYVNEFLEGAVAHLHGENENITQENAELAKHATEDPLTGLDNRRSFLEKAGKIISQMAREERERADGRRKEGGIKHLTIGMLDVDHFKNVNDTHGHPAGDAVLQAVAEHLQKLVRPNDVVGRWGGEEFIIAFQGVDEETILKRLGFDPHKNQDAHIGISVNVEGKEINITLSGGLSEYRIGEKIEDAISQADQGLYYSKKHGRNKITVLEETEPEKEI